MSKENLSILFLIFFASNGSYANGLEYTCESIFDKETLTFFRADKSTQSKFSYENQKGNINVTLYGKEIKLIKPSKRDKFTVGVKIKLKTDSTYKSVNAIFGHEDFGAHTSSLTMNFLLRNGDLSIRPAYKCIIRKITEAN